MQNLEIDLLQQKRYASFPRVRITGLSAQELVEDVDGIVTPDSGVHTTLACNLKPWSLSISILRGTKSGSEFSLLCVGGLIRDEYPATDSPVWSMASVLP